MVQVNRRGFLASAATVAVVALAEDEKLTDGGYAEVTPPGAPARATPLVPPGADGVEGFARRCVGCQLCVTQCPNQVLRPLKARHPGAPLEMMQPVMGFEHGYCRPECTACGDVCPAGAIRRLTPQQKKTVRVGHAVWNKDLCLAAAEGLLGAASTLELVSIVDFALFQLYNGKRGRQPKYLFYIFYPAHLLLLYLAAKAVYGV